MLDFPHSPPPQVGDLYPDPSIPNVPQWRWDGARWVATGADVTGMVRYNMGQALTVDEQRQARENIGAAIDNPSGTDAPELSINIFFMQINAMQINGGMDVSQNLGPDPVSIPAGTASTYVVDQFGIFKTGPSVLSAQQITTSLPPGYIGALQLQATTPQPSIGADAVGFFTRIEGLRFARAGWGSAGAIPVSVGFWARMTLPGTYRINGYNHDFMSNAGWQQFDIDVGGVWQWVTVQFPAQTIGSWFNDNRLGIEIHIEVASSATPNIVAAAGQTAAITGMIVLPGTELPIAESARFVLRSYLEELRLCQRYWAIADAYIRGSFTNTPWIERPFSFPEVMRAMPTINFRTAPSRPPNSSNSNLGLWNIVATSDRSGRFFVQGAAAGEYFGQGYINLNARL